MMRIVSIEAKSLSIPFRQGFRHASADRSSTQSVWVEVRTADGVRGCGEGCPRQYVTGESVASALAFIMQYRAQWQAAIRTVEDVRDRARRHSAEIDRDPAAWCAVEVALLDALGRSTGATLEQSLGLPDLAAAFVYTAVLGDAPPEAFATQLGRYVGAGFGSFKIKLSGDLARDRAKVDALVRAGIAPAAVRADANNLWPDPAAARSHMQALAWRFPLIEEPLPARAFAAMAMLAEEIDCAVVLDESVATVADLARLEPPNERWVVNVRVSKMGGILRSLQVVERARVLGLAVVVGAHVGETSVLARAALPVADAARERLLGQEGAFGTHLLLRDVTAGPVMFGRGGFLDPMTMPGWRLPGLGIAYLDRPDDETPLYASAAG